MSRDAMIQECGLSPEEAQWFNHEELVRFMLHKKQREQRAHGHAMYTPSEVRFDPPSR
jgi:hypothetical protein